MRRKNFVVEAIEARLLLATISVLNTDDSGAGSLRQAIADAEAGDTVDLTGVSGTITLATQLMINKNLTIAGPGVDDLSISGNDAVRVFYIPSNTVSISGLTITQGNSTGGGIYTNGNLTLTRVALTHNSGGSGGAVYLDGSSSASMTDVSVTDNEAIYNGGGILSWGHLTMTRCTIANNSVHSPIFEDPFFDESWGGSGAGGGVGFYQGTVTLTNCTITGNTVTADSAPEDPGTAQGGGIYIVNGNAHVTIINSTISGNSVSAEENAGGGIYLYSNNETLTMTNTIVAGNSADSDPDVRLGGTVTSGGNNLIGEMSSNAIFVDGENGDQVGSTASPIDPMLDILANNGGHTETMALLADSPAVDAGKSAGAPSSDQRGQIRVGAVDIGAFELAEANASPEFSSTPITAATGGDAYSYSIEASDENDDDLTITATTKPQWLTLSDNGDGTATLTGTPLHSDFGAAQVVLELSDGEDTIEQSFFIDIAVPAWTRDGDNILHLNGTDNDDSIHVWVRERDFIRVIINGTMKNYVKADVEQIQIHSFAGNDTVLINTAMLPSYALGGDGDDTLTGGPGNDTLTGGGGKDLLTGNGGDDRLNGSGGKDKIVGGEGSDRLYGGAGDDLLSARDLTFDSLFGEEGNDSAYADDLDEKDGIETLLA